MKTVAVIYNNSNNLPAIDFIQHTLETIFENRIQVTNYFFNQFKEDTVIAADAILLANRNLLSRVSSHISDYKVALIMERSIQNAMISAILDIPVGTDVLLVNDSYESSVYTANALYELGIGHLHFIPYDVSREPSGIYRHLDYAITPGESSFVPPYIKKVIDFRPRMISCSTLLKLSDVLQLNSEIITRNIIQHVNLLAETNKSHHAKFLDNLLMNQMINLVVRDSPSATLVVNTDFEPVYSNEQANILFRINPFQNAAPTLVLDDKMISLLTSIESNDIVELGGERYIVKKTPLSLIDQLLGYCFTFQSETNLRQMEISLNQHLRQRGLFAKYHFQDIIFKSSSMEKVIAIAKQAAVTDHTVLIRGESGTGKELLAQSIHNYSGRADRPFVAINCNTLPESLLESQLFGYEGGSFTGARKEGKPGLFEQANQGTIFLDEIGDISPNMQSQLLRVLQERQIMRIGSNKVIDLDLRIIAATNQDLEKLVSEGKFRSDLFYRLNIIPVAVPPLRQRKEDILPLLSIFLGSLYTEVTPEEREAIFRYQWPGNVRQLEGAAKYYQTLHAFPDYLYVGTSKEKKNTNVAVSTVSMAPTASDNLSTPYHSPHFPSSQPAEDSPNLDSPNLGSPSLDSPNLSRRALDHCILSMISAATGPFHGIGRSNILSHLKEQHIKVSDGKLREILFHFEREGYITIERGRGGCRITESGAAYLKALE